jgi:hypothetical protein
MRREPPTVTRSRAVMLVASVGALAVLATGCSSGGAKTTTTSTPPAAANVSTTASSTAAPPTSSAPAAAVDLSGTWSGQYSGAFTGTFKLTWQQTGSTLSGTIDLSTDGTENLTGTVNGSKITFGTVGSQAITYTGTASGSSMSGTYQVAGQAGGNWSATKS